jgi:hypothetical protein
MGNNYRINVWPKVQSKEAAWAIPKTQKSQVSIVDRELIHNLYPGKCPELIYTSLLVKCNGALIAYFQKLFRNPYYEVYRPTVLFKAFGIN